MKVINQLQIVQEFQYLVVGSGVGLAQSMVCFGPSIQQRKQDLVYNCKVNDVGVVYNQHMKYLQTLVNKSLTW